MRTLKVLRLPVDAHEGIGNRAGEGLGLERALGLLGRGQGLVGVALRRMGAHQQTERLGVGHHLALAQRAVGEHGALVVAGGYEVGHEPVELAREGPHAVLGRVDKELERASRLAGAPARVDDLPDHVLVGLDQLRLRKVEGLQGAVEVGRGLGLVEEVGDEARANGAILGEARLEDLIGLLGRQPLDARQPVPVQLLLRLPVYIALHCACRVVSCRVARVVSCVRTARVMV
jgi:hypothetical protein